MKGATLRGYREIRRVRQVDLARAMGLPRQSIAQVERQANVWPTTCLRYFRALFSLTTPGAVVTMQIDLLVDGEVQGSEVVE